MRYGKRNRRTPKKMILDSHTHAWPRWPYQPPVPDDESRGKVEQLLHEMDFAQHRQGGADLRAHQQERR